MKDQRAAIIEVHLAVILMGGTPLFAKIISLPVDVITLYRSVVGLIFLGLWCHFKGLPLRLKSRNDGALMLLTGFLMAAHWVTYFHSIQVSTVAVGLAAIFTFPVITVFIEPLWHRGLPHWQDVISGVLVIIGILILVPEFDLNNDTALGVVWGVFSAFIYALRNVIVRKTLNHYSGMQIMCYQFLGILIALIPFQSFEQDLWVDHRLWWIVLLGIGFTAIPHSLFVGSMRVLSAKSASLIACLQPLYGTLAAWVLLSEVPNWQTWVGGALIVGAASYESVKVSNFSPKS